MIATVRRYASIYGAIAAMWPKMFLAYSVWVWMHLIVQVMALIIFVAFWTAVFAEQQTIGGLNLQQTLNYIILAQVFTPTVDSSNTLYYFGDLMREGKVGIELLRPVDFQAANYVGTISRVALGLVTQLPLALVAWLLYRFQLSGDPLVWFSFLVTLLLGNAVLFFFDWILACISFYSTETWGLSVLRAGALYFFSGALVPLTMMPPWLQTLATAMPFSHALYMPISIFSGITPPTAAPRIWLLQLTYLIVLGFLSRIVFRISVRKVTVQGG